MIRRFRSLDAFLGTALVFALVLGASETRAQCDCPVEDTLIIGHRGSGTNGPSEPPENTLPSVEAAYADGAAMVEIDAQLTADGVLVLMHDGTVDRTTDGTGCVSELTAAEIGALSADGTPVPTLDELLMTGTGGVNIEIKISEGGGCAAQDLDATADAVATSVQAHAGGREILVSSFDLGVLQRLRAADATIPIGYLSTDPSDIDVAAAEGFEAIHLLAIGATPRVVARAHAAGLAMNVWTVNNASPVERALGMGVDAVITDTVSVAVTARGSFCDAYVCPVDGGAAADAGPSGGSDAGGCAVSSRRAAPMNLVLLVGASWWLRRRIGA